MSYKIIIASIALLIMLTMTSIAGCSGRDITNPPLQSNTDEKSSQSHYLWGLFQFICEPAANSMDIIPLRAADMHLNVLPFLEPPPLTNLTLESLTFNGNIIEADIGLRHPFLGLTEFTGFDVSGIVISNGSYSGFEDASIKIAGPGDLRLLNADGHSRWWNPLEFPAKPSAPITGYVDGLLGTPNSAAHYNATINGYKYFADGLAAEDPVTKINPALRGLFRPGQKIIRHYTIDMGTSGLIFNYAIDACWQFPQGSKPWEAPGDFSPNANRKEPYNINVIETTNSLWYNGSSYGGKLSLDINVYDWFDIDKDWVKIESPAALDPVDITTPSGGDTYSTFHVDLTDVNLTSNDDLMLLISAYCDDVGFQGYLPGKTTAAYNVHYAKVAGEPSMNPTAVAKTCDCLYVAPGGKIEFDGTDSYSPNGSIVSYEWDFNGDGDFSDPYAGTMEKPTATYLNEGEFWVNLKVTDNAGYSDTLDTSEQLHVFVGYFSHPTALAVVVPTIGFIDFAGDFKGSLSTGTVIKLYEWDFEGDCIWDYSHPTIGDTTHAYTVPGDYTAILRVTGNGCSTDSEPVRMIDPEPIIVNGNFWDATFSPWTHDHWVKPGPLTEEIITSPIFRNIVHFYSGPTSDGNCTWIDQDLDKNLSSYTSIYFNLFFYVDFNTLNGDGYLAGDPDIKVRIGYEDAVGGYYEVWYGYDTSFDGTWQWDSAQPAPWTMPAYVVYHHQELVALDTWCEKKTIDLMTLTPKPAKLTKINICCMGWSWNAFVTLPWFSKE